MHEAAAAGMNVDDVDAYDDDEGVFASPKGCCDQWGYAVSSWILEMRMMRGCWGSAGSQRCSADAYTLVEDSLDTKKLSRSRAKRNGFCQNAKHKMAEQFVLLLNEI